MIETHCMEGSWIQFDTWLSRVWVTAVNWVLSFARQLHALSSEQRRAVRDLSTLLPCLSRQLTCDVTVVYSIVTCRCCVCAILIHYYQCRLVIHSLASTALWFSLSVSETAIFTNCDVELLVDQILQLEIFSLWRLGLGLYFSYL